MFDMAKAQQEIANLRRSADNGTLILFHGQLRTREEIAGARRIEGGYVL